MEAAVTGVCGNKAVKVFARHDEVCVIVPGDEVTVPYCTKESAVSKGVGYALAPAEGVDVLEDFQKVRVYVREGQNLHTVHILSSRSRLPETPGRG